MAVIVERPQIPTRECRGAEFGGSPSTRHIAEGYGFAMDRFRRATPDCLGTRRSAGLVRADNQCRIIGVPKQRSCRILPHNTERSTARVAVS
ncbi:hypothetical protein OPAG_05802 [Rhodococcus opacus PD630]|nr:hypothetical protein Pd630_LPD05308 [Rhodococcus opacus PD630]EHI42504.1 hypothetical protein OPAG_05802 [Rhodococcus opacus PD630]RZK75082.1 MAG: hypothetical protein EOP28_01120 [Rhodococcus sp. (in: high G+C Gram-positive bacteria)]